MPARRAWAGLFTLLPLHSAFTAVTISATLGLSVSSLILSCPALFCPSLGTTAAHSRTVPDPCNHTAAQVRRLLWGCQHIPCPGEGQRGVQGAAARPALLRWQLVLCPSPLLGAHSAKASSAQHPTPAGATGLPAFLQPRAGPSLKQAANKKNHLLRLFPVHKNPSKLFARLGEMPQLSRGVSVPVKQHSQPQVPGTRSSACRK